MKNLKEKRGITLITLVITIIVLIILAGVTIVTLTGDNGLLQKAGETKQTVNEAKIEEQIKLTYLEYEMMKYNKIHQTLAEFMQEKLRTTLGDNKLTVTENDETLLVTLSIGKLYEYNRATGKTDNFLLISKSIDTNYVGFYADIDVDGTVDGVIFADLLVGNTNGDQWTDSNGAYTIPTINENSLKNYYVSQENYSGIFGTKDVISPKAINGSDRFYLMSLSDIDNANKYMWYNSARNNVMSDYSTTTSKKFGTGRINTETMIKKWNNNDYGTKNDNDLWGHIQTEVDKGWFVPSKEEWSAFSNELKINRENHNLIYGLGGQYWSSTQGSNALAFTPNYYWVSPARMDTNYVSLSNYVRLATTF